MQHSNLLLKADFSEKIKTYILLSVSLVLLVTVIGIPLLLVWLLGLRQYISKRYYENLKCHLTERHLVFSKGAFFKVEKTIPLENIQDLTFLQNPILNWLELKVLKIETAGGSNPYGSDMKLIGIRDAQSFKEEVLEQREKIRIKSEGGSPVGNIGEEQLKVLREIRDLLLDLRVDNKEKLN
jgi:putative membrane protein